MSAGQLERLQEQMQRLRLFKSRERLEALLQDATAKDVCQLRRLGAGPPRVRGYAPSRPDHEAR